MARLASGSNLELSKNRVMGMIDSYLADLNVAVDELGGRANLVGVCQGGWMVLVYAARYPSKVRGLVLAGAPVRRLRALEDAARHRYRSEKVRRHPGLFLARLLRDLSHRA